MLPFNIYEHGFSKGLFFFKIYPELLEAEQEEEEGGTLARKVGEAVTNTFGVVVTAIDIPLGECFPETKPKGEGLCNLNK